MYPELCLTVPTSRKYSRFSPLRYPGGKAPLTDFFKEIIYSEDIDFPVYVEPYAGGAGAGIALLLSDVIERLVINDLDPTVAAFWNSIVFQSDDFIRLIEETPITVDEWKKQRYIYNNSTKFDSLAVGFSFFFLNRTNRSGILKAGVIGGLQQNGNYLIDARFRKKTLIERINKIKKYSSKITVLNRDGKFVLDKYLKQKNAFIYIDPPYVKAGGELYLNAFNYSDHYELSQLLHKNRYSRWLLTYDDEIDVHQLYDDMYVAKYMLHYSAGSVRDSQELMIASDKLSSIVNQYQSNSKAQLYQN